MAIFHMSFKVLKRSEGKSSVYLSAYQNREKTIDNRTGATWDYSNKTGLFDSFILSPAHTPKDLIESSATLWNAVEATEKRKDAQLSRYFDVALPVELDDEQKKQLVIDYCQENFVAYGMIADIALHDLDSKNPHAHVMLTMREITQEGFKNKVREWNDKENIDAWRNNWEVSANKALKTTGHKSRIDSRSLEEQKKEAQQKAKVTKDPKKKAIWISKAIELDRKPMTRIHRNNWQNGRKLRRLEEEEKAILFKLAKINYHQLTKPIEPEESMKIQKTPISQKIKDIYEKAKNKVSEIADLFKPKPKKEKEPEFKSSYITDEFGNHIKKEDGQDWERKNQAKINKQLNEKKEREEAERARFKKEDEEERLKNKVSHVEPTNKRKLKR